MCTVTFVSQKKGQGLLFSNRDEQPGRASQTIVKSQIHGQTLVFPQDPTAGGTWIVASDRGSMVCLLNGAAEGHRRQPPYRLSRGIMVLDSFAFPGPPEFLANYNLMGIEPFTLVWYTADDQLWELRWDGVQVALRALHPQGAYLWSSATLYDAPARAQRQAWFDEWLREHPSPTALELLHFHQTAGQGDAFNGVVMNRPGIVQTVSITSLLLQPGLTELQHLDLLTAETHSAQILHQRELEESR